MLETEKWSKIAFMALIENLREKCPQKFKGKSAQGYLGESDFGHSGRLLPQWLVWFWTILGKCSGEMPSDI